MRKLLLAALVLSVSATSALGAELAGTLKKIKESGTISLGYREASYPFSFLDEDQKPVGYSIDLCLRIADAVKETLGLGDLEVNYVLVNPETRIPLVKDGTIDIECGSTTNTLTRQEEVDFTHTTFVTGAMLLVKTASGIEGFRDMKGKSIGLVEGTTTDRRP